MTTDIQESDHIEPGQEWTVDIFRPEDAPGVVSLFLSVYGPEYPVKKFLDPRRLIQENESRSILSIVARTPGGEIVGHSAIFPSAPNPRLYESGSGLVHRHYRGGYGIFTEMVSRSLNYAVEELGAVGTFGEPVCNHPFTQKLSLRLSYPIMALEVDLMPASAYAKEKSSLGRVSTLLNFCIKVHRSQEIFLPDRYAPALEFLYQGLDDPRTFTPSRESIPWEETTRIDVQYFDFAQVARLVVHSAGPDLFGEMEKIERDLVAKGVVVIQVWIKLTWPWVAQVTEGLRRRGYFLGGLLPRWFDDDGMLMQKRFGRPDWEGMVILTDHSKELVRLVRADWEEVTR